MYKINTPLNRVENPVNSVKKVRQNRMALSLLETKSVPFIVIKQLPNIFK